MTKGKYLAAICDGEIELYLLTDEDIEEALEVLRKSFFIHENLCIATDINKSNNEDAINELTELARSIAKDGISIVAKHVPTGKLAGVALNKIHQSCTQNKSAQEEFLAKFVDSTCRTENVKCIMRTLTSVETKFDMFSEWNIDCIVEHFMLSTLPEFGKRNIGYNLSLQSIQLAMELNQSDDSNSLTNYIPEHLRHCKPKAIYAIFTSKFSHKIGQRLGFKDLAKIPFTEFNYKGENFADKLDPIHEYCVLGARKF